MAPEPASPWHILVVEDDVDAAAMTKKLIEKSFDASVAIAEDCATARSLLSGDDFDAVVLDYNLPDGTGLQLLAEISKSESPPAAVMITGQGDEETAAEAFRLHASGYLVKDRRLGTMLPEVLGGALAEISLRRAQEALRRSEEVESALLNATTESLFLLDRDGAVLAINRTAAERVGHEPDEMMGQVIYDYWAGELASTRRERIDKVFRTGEPVNFEDARQGITFAIAVYPVAGAEGGVDRVAVFGLDITERRRAEEELRRARDELEERVKERTAELVEVNEALRKEIAERKRAEEVLKSLTEQVQGQAKMLDEILSASPDQFYLVDVNGKFIYGSRAAAEMFGVEQEELSGKYWWDLGFSAEMMQPFDIQREAVFTSGEAHKGEIRFPTTHGLRDYEYFMNPIHRPDGRVGAVVVTARDINEQKESAEELERRSAKLAEQAQLLDLTHDTIMVKDMNNVVVFWNRGAEEMYGWKHEEAIGKVTHDLLKTRFPQPLEEIEYELLHEGRWEGELVHVARDGRQLTVSSRWALKWGETGQPESILEINTDMTEQKKLQEAELLDLIPQPIIVRDMNNNIVLWNRAASERYGWSKDEALGKNTYELLKTEFPKPREEIEFDLLKSGTWQGTLTHAARDGSRVVEKSNWVLKWTDHGESSAILEINSLVEPGGRP